MPIVLDKTGPQKITKLDAGLRQLDEAIRLFFERRDPISVHTVASAAHEILTQLAKHLKGYISPTSPDSALIKDDKRAWYRAKLRESNNFFKHAGRDADGMIEFRPEETRFVIFDALLVAGQIHPADTPERLAYRAWFILAYPGVLFESAMPPENQALIKSFRDKVRADEFDLFREMIRVQHQQTPAAAP